VSQNSLSRRCPASSVSVPQLSSRRHTSPFRAFSQVSKLLKSPQHTSRPRSLPFRAFVWTVRLRLGARVQPCPGHVAYTFPSVWPIKFRRPHPPPPPLPPCSTRKSSAGSHRLTAASAVQVVNGIRSLSAGEQKTGSLRFVDIQVHVSFLLVLIPVLSHSLQVAHRANLSMLTRRARSSRRTNLQHPNS
jgi:hypothetical protein